MTLARYEPWTMLDELRRDLTRAMEPGRVRGWREGDFLSGQWTPAVDIHEQADKFLIEADIPGVDPKDIEVTMENGQLTIKGERAAESEEHEESFHRVERARGQFLRRFTLPDTADPEKIEAKADNGVLKVTIPKGEKAQPRKIAVH